MTRILITSMGGSGSLNLVDSIRLFDRDKRIEIIGTHFNPYELAKSDLEHLYVVPRVADAQSYVDAHLKLIDKLKVDLLIANSDAEAAVLAGHRNELRCAHLLPPLAQVEMVQDKYRFYDVLARQGCRTVKNIPVPSREGVDEAIRQLGLPNGERFWIRLREGSGSQGATWLYNGEQARKWMDLWCELRGFDPTDFVVAPFLPGQDFCVSVLFQNGEMCVAKAYERLAYYTEDVSLSMMGSTPKTSQTTSETHPIEAAIEAIEGICREFGVLPHGLYQADLKCDASGRSYVTEINIGRFPMTSPQFDRVGKYSQIELYIRLALDPQHPLPRGEIDLDPGYVFLRGVDLPLVMERAERIEKLRASTV